MKMIVFSGRCAKEILRDPLTLCFGLGFPLILLVLLNAMQANIPVPMFELSVLTPGIAVFGLSFMTLFSATLISKDRESAFLQRLYTSPLTEVDFIAGYMLPLIPISVGQTAICYICAVFMGLHADINILPAIVGIIPVAVFHVALGMFFGNYLSVKQVGGICGALLTNLSAWLSGVWFDLSLVGGWFEKAAKMLPFVHAVEMEKALFSGNMELALSHSIPVILYGATAVVIAVLSFVRNTKRR